MQRSLALLYQIFPDKLEKRLSTVLTKETRMLLKLISIGRAASRRASKMTLVYVDDDKDEATKKQQQKEEHIKRLFELSDKSLGEIPQLEEPTEEQKRWVLGKLKRPAKYWEAFK